MRFISRVVSAACLFLALQPVQAAAAPAETGYMVFVGTYTKDGSKGIYAYRFNPGSGKLAPIGLAGETESPSFLALHPNHRFLYAVNEKKSGTVIAFSINGKTGHLTLLNTVASGGDGPCHLVVDQTGKTLVVANYGSGSVAAFPIRPDGGLKEASALVKHSGSSTGPRQAGPHAHMTQLSPDNRFILVPDLGLDQVITYRLDPAKATLTPGPKAQVTPGLGPRHLAFHPNGGFDYLINEMDSAVTAFAYDKANGSLNALQTISTLPKGFTGTDNSAEIQVHPNGKFVYASNRGDDSIAIFSIDVGKGTLKAAGRVSTQGKTPRNFAIDPTGAFLFAANQDSGNIVSFRVNPDTGGLTPTGDEIKVPQPVCIVFMPVN